MLHRHPRAEGVLQAADHLGRQADLRHQNQRLTPKLQRAADQLKKYQRFAAARHPVQQGRVGGVVLQIRGQLVVSSLLLFGEGRRRFRGRSFGRCHRPGVLILPLLFRQPLFQKGLQHRPGHALSFQLGRRLGAARRQKVQGRALFVRNAAAGLHGPGRAVVAHLLPKQLPPQGGLAVHQLGPVLGPVGNDGPHGLIVGTEGAFLQKMHQLQQIRGQPGLLRGCCKQLLQPRRLFRRRFFPHGQHHRHAGAVAPAEWHQNHAALKHLPFQLRGQPVGVQLIEMEGGIVHGHLYRAHGMPSPPRCCFPQPFWYSRIIWYSFSAQVSRSSFTSVAVYRGACSTSRRAVAIRP